MPNIQDTFNLQLPIMLQPNNQSNKNNCQSKKPKVKNFPVISDFSQSIVLPTTQKNQENLLFKNGKMHKLNFFEKVIVSIQTRVTWCACFIVSLLPDEGLQKRKYQSPNSSPQRSYSLTLTKTTFHAVVIQPKTPCSSTSLTTSPKPIRISLFQSTLMTTLLLFNCINSCNDIQVGFQILHSTTDPEYDNRISFSKTVNVYLHIDESFLSFQNYGSEKVLCFPKTLANRENLLMIS